MLTVLPSSPQEGTSRLVRCREEKVEVRGSRDRTTRKVHIIRVHIFQALADMDGLQF